MQFARKILPVLAMLLAGMVAGCSENEGVPGSFDRTLGVSGPVVLDLTTGAGNVKIAPGGSSTVQIHGDFRVRMLPWENSGQRVKDVTDHPPIDQSGNLIRIGHDMLRGRNVVINYTIEVPQQTELRGVLGSGDLQVRGIHGPARITTGSGDVTAEQIGEDVQGLSGSGDIHFIDIAGEAQATAGSGDLEFANVQGSVRAHTGSGDITITRPAGSVDVGAGSGDITVKDAGGNLRLRTGSGDLMIDGNPANSSYWDLRTSSGGVTLQVPQTASFRFYAHSTSGKIDTALPMVVEERPKHELRARVGDGKARIEVETSSGDISVH